MADVSLPALQGAGIARLISRLIEQWRVRSHSARAIDPAALSDHMQRDLGFRDGRSRPAPVAPPAADLSAWR
ncbi:MAG: hypothetical protein ABSF67_05065 [Roseiarcus sp.]|jgi:hypothetical protein